MLLEEPELPSPQSGISDRVCLVCKGQGVAEAICGVNGALQCSSNALRHVAQAMSCWHAYFVGLPTGWPVSCRCACRPVTCTSDGIKVPHCGSAEAERCCRRHGGCPSCPIILQIINVQGHLMMTGRGTRPLRADMQAKPTSRITLLGPHAQLLCWMLNSAISRELHDVHAAQPSRFHAALHLTVKSSAALCKSPCQQHCVAIK
jgi:hypothetical protein